MGSGSDDQIQATPTFAKLNGLGQNTARYNDSCSQGSLKGSVLMPNASQYHNNVNRSIDCRQGNNFMESLSNGGGAGSNITVTYKHSEEFKSLHEIFLRELKVVELIQKTNLATQG